MLQNFLDALDSTGASQDLKRVILVTGAKHYGVHLGRPKEPMEESFPWLRDSKWPPNFYYRQQDIVHKFCDEHKIEWIVTYPNDVIGYAKGNFMNLATALGIYAAVTKELGQDLVFPGNPFFYSSFDCFTESKLHAQFVEWAALSPRTGNQAFNVVNGDTESWENLWPRVANRFGMKVKENQFESPVDPKHQEMEGEPPVSIFAEEIGLVGQIKPSNVKLQLDLTKWNQDKRVRQAWGTLAEREGLETEAFDKATWAFLNFILGREYPIVISMSKARQFGWAGYV
jgi:nucleoside-diphosphate-sugar epimerase